MKKKDRRGKDSDCYFQSDDEQSQSYQQQVKEEEEMEDTKQDGGGGIESLGRIEIFQIFCQAKNIRKIVAQNQQNYTVVNKFYWRVQYIFGEIIIMVQDYLISQNLLAHSLKMQVADIRYICEKLMEQAESNQENEQFQYIKEQMLVLYRSNRLNSKTAIRMYNFWVGIWKIPLQFSLDFMKPKKKPLDQFQDVTYSNFPKEAANSPSEVVQEQTVNAQKQTIIPMINSPINILTTDSSPSSYIPESRIGPFSVTRMPVQLPSPPARHTQHTNTNKPKERVEMVRNRQTASNYPLNLQSNNYSSSDQQTQKQRFRREMTEPQNNSICMKVSSSFENERQRPKNSISFGPSEHDQLKKWRSKEQALLCQIYNKTETSVDCLQQLQDLLGMDARWKNVEMIESKMCSLVNKVFNKFMTLQTRNESIKLFKANRRAIMDCRNPHLRRCIFQEIAIIYISMLYVNQSKKEEISRRIIQVNRLSRHISQPEAQMAFGNF